MPCANPDTAGHAACCPNARREYVLGWWWGYASGSTSGAATTGLAVTLWHVLRAAWSCPTC